MTKAEMIARYGQQYYDDHEERCRRKLNAKYAAMSPAERTTEYKRKIAYKKQWDAANKEKQREYFRKVALENYRKLSPEARLAIATKRREARRAKKLADPAFYADALVKDNARVHNWRVNNQDRWAAYGEKRRSLPKAPPKFIAFLRSQPCLDCGKAPIEGRRSEVGHLIPVRHGGTNHPCNLIAQCRSCNGKQHAKTHPRFAQINYPEAVAYAAAAA